MGLIVNAIDSFCSIFKVGVILIPDYYTPDSFSIDCALLNRIPSSLSNRIGE
jgi:hypothetical protein